MRWKRWEKATRKRQARESMRIYERIKGGGRDWLADLL
jgi:hypothetical protein